MTTRYRLKEKPDYETQYSDKKVAMDALLEDVKTPMDLDEALNELVKLTQMQASSSSWNSLSFSNSENYPKQIDDLKKYIKKLKS